MGESWKGNLTFFKPGNSSKGPMELSSFSTIRTICANSYASQPYTHPSCARACARAHTLTPSASSNTSAKQAYHLDRTDCSRLLFHIFSVLPIKSFCMSLLSFLQPWSLSFFWRTSLPSWMTHSVPSQTLTCHLHNHQYYSKLSHLTSMMKLQNFFSHLK